ncbi:MAG: hypothetical protein J5806_02985 [Lentisphaeria bacterium]|nr:hypothetical protein [Lentisphaeria bacterium]
MKWIALSAETKDVVRDQNGVPVEWTILKVGENPICQEGRDGAIMLSAEGMRQIISYHEKKGEEIPIDSEHYLYELANQKKLDEGETLKLFPGGVAAMGFGRLVLSGDRLRIKAKWNPAAYEMLKEKIYKYFSPVIRGLENGPLRVTSVAMTNTPAINNLDALAASATKLSGKSDTSDKSDRKGTMNKLEQALKRLTGRDSVALGGEVSEEEKDKIACEVEAKADLIEQVKKLLGLEAGATLEQVVAALKGMDEKAKSADDKQAQLDQMAASAEKAEHARQVARGRAERKIVDADMEYVNSLDSKALSAYLDHAAPKFPAPMERKVTERKPDAVALSSVDRIAIDSLRNAGVKDAETEYLKRKGK